MSVEAKYCDTCGCSMLYSMDDGSQMNISALQFSLAGDGQLAGVILGPYEHKEYGFCYQCCLRALGVKP